MRRDRLRAASLFFTIACAAAACTDLRDYRGDWSGERIGSAAALDVGVATDASARLAIDSVDEHGLAGTLSVDGMIGSATIQSLAGAEADALAGTTFTGSPLHVYFAFAALDDGSGQGLVLVALFPQQRVEVRVLRGNPAPIYAIFALQPSP
jgi:hypothetical protein|nr:hypothetical protein [Kofleriaceae bacterium]